MSTQVKTPRLLLREIELTDLDFLTLLLGHPAVMRFWPRPFTPDEAAAWIQQQQARYANDGHGYWLALDRTTGQPVGQAGLMTIAPDGLPEPSVGYIFHPSAWGRGLALEAAHGCIAYGFEKRRFPRITCLVRPENVRSLRVAMRLGFLPEKHIVYKDLAHLFLTMSPPAEVH